MKKTSSSIKSWPVASQVCPRMVLKSSQIVTLHALGCFFQIKTIDDIQGYPRMVSTYRLSASLARIYCLDREQPKCVTKGYYIIARSASWGPSVPLGGFRPPGICGCSLGLLKYNCMYHRYSKNETSNGDAYSAIIKLKYQNAVSGFYSQKCVLTNCSLREPGAIGPTVPRLIIDFSACKWSLNHKNNDIKWTRMQDFSI